MYCIGHHTNTERGSPTATGCCFFPSQWWFPRSSKGCAASVQSNRTFEDIGGGKENMPDFFPKLLLPRLKRNHDHGARKDKQAATREGLAWWGRQYNAVGSCGPPGVEWCAAAAAALVEPSQCCVCWMEGRSMKLQTVSSKHIHCSNLKVSDKVFIQQKFLNYPD